MVLRTGVERPQHPVVGVLDLTYEAMELQADPGLTIFTYTAEPGTPSEDGLKLLASWAAPQDLAEGVTTDSAVSAREQQSEG
ncbi:MAG: hypothetical protein QOE62_3533 [Actinomycetota bacterium]|jgi:hypothetical protein|nr:hypothetical protein [Actinomycetota bacterium]